MNLRHSLKKLAYSNALGRRLFIWKYERHLGTLLRNAGNPCRIYPTGNSTTFALRKDTRVIILNLKDAVHGGFVAEHFDSYFAATKPSIEDGLMTVNYSVPKLHVLASGLEFEFPSFPEEPESIDDYTRWYQPKPGDLIYDLGANCGFSVYHFSKMVGPGGRVVCFEPDQINLGFLKKNLARHKLSNVTLVEAAVGASDGTAQFYSEGTLGSGLADILSRTPVGDVINVPVISLHTAFGKYGVPNLCKMDIEGAEVETLQGVAKYLGDLNINFVVDTVHIVNGETTAERVETIFRQAGYETKTITLPALTTYGRPASMTAELEVKKLS